MHRNRKTPRTAARLLATVETMEPRRLLSASLDKGLLAVTGTDQDDVIVVTASGQKISVQVNGELKSFRLQGIKSVRIGGDAGDDRIRVNGKLDVRCRIEGDGGDDTLTGGQGVEVLLGGDGLDYIRGNSGDDRIMGGGDDDSLRGDRGDDRLYGEAGNDDMYGDAGDDSVDGGLGHDNIEGGRGRDRCWGRSGRDVFHANDDRGEIRDRNTSDDRSVLVSSSQVPAAAMDAFNAAYPDAILKKIELEKEDGVLAYEFKFIEDGALLKAKFDADGTFIEGEMSLNDLPEAVRTAFAGQFPDVTVDEVKYELEGSVGVYKIEFLTGESQRGRARYRADGAAAGDDDSEHLSFDQLPDAVKNAFTRAFPGATVREVESETEHGVLEYKISFFDTHGARQRARFNANGKWIDW